MTQDQLNEDLLSACQRRNLTAVKKALKEGADINMPDKDGWTALHFAAREDNSPLAELLINNAALVNARTKKGLTPFRLASIHQNYRTETLLKQHGGIE